jgi:cytochrome c2
MRAAASLAALGMLALPAAGQPLTSRVVGGDAEAGRRAVAAHGCGVCHIVPGVRGARGTVGPSLERFGERNVIGGLVPNTPEWLTRGLANPPAIAPGTMMPPMQLEREELVNVAAFLLSLRAD